MMPKTWLETLSRDYCLQDMLPKTGELLCVSAEPLSVSEAAASKPRLHKLSVAKKSHSVTFPVFCRVLLSNTRKMTRKNKMENDTMQIH